MVLTVPVVNGYIVVGVVVCSVAVVGTVVVAGGFVVLAVSVVVICAVVVAVVVGLVAVLAGFPNKIQSFFGNYNQSSELIVKKLLFMLFVCYCNYNAW